MPSQKPKAKKTGTTGKKNSRKKTDRKNNVSQAETATHQIMAGKKYVAINESDPVAESKIKIVWIAVIILGIILLSFWFWTLKNNLNKPINNQEFTGLTQDIKSKFASIGNILQESEDRINEADQQAQQQQDLAKIKSDVMAQIQLNLDSSSWPKHTSETLGLAISYPTYWQKQETGNSLNLKIINSTSTADSNVGRVTIAKVANPQNISLADWVASSQIDLKNYSIDNTLSIDNQPTVKYILNDTNNIDWLIFTGFKKNIYKISVVINEGQGLYEPMIDKVLSTIGFIK